MDLAIVLTSYVESKHDSPCLLVDPNEVLDRSPEFNQSSLEVTVPVPVRLVEFSGQHLVEDCHHLGET